VDGTPPLCSAVMVACPARGAMNPDSVRFCGSCGVPLAAAASSGRGERKTVTGPFTDLVGLTARSEVLDPEDVRAFLPTGRECGGSPAGKESRA